MPSLYRAENFPTPSFFSHVLLWSGCHQRNQPQAVRFQGGIACCCVIYGDMGNIVPSVALSDLASRICCQVLHFAKWHGEMWCPVFRYLMWHGEYDAWCCVTWPDLENTVPSLTMVCSQTNIYTDKSIHMAISCCWNDFRNLLISLSPAAAWRTCSAQIVVQPIYHTWALFGHILLLQRVSQRSKLHPSFDSMENHHQH